MFVKILGGLEELRLSDLFRVNVHYPGRPPRFPLRDRRRRDGRAPSDAVAEPRNGRSTARPSVRGMRSGRSGPATLPTGQERALAGGLAQTDRTARPPGRGRSERDGHPGVRSAAVGSEFDRVRRRGGRRLARPAGRSRDGLSIRGLRRKLRVTRAADPPHGPAGLGLESSVSPHLRYVGAAVVAFWHCVSMTRTLLERRFHEAHLSGCPETNDPYTVPGGDADRPR